MLLLEFLLFAEMGFISVNTVNFAKIVVTTIIFAVSESDSGYVYRNPEILCSIKWVVLTRLEQFLGLFDLIVS
jgi:hypothetical protein